MRLADYLSVDAIETDFVATDKESTLRGLARLLSVGDGCLDEERVFQVFSDREQLATTGVGSGVAIPHGRLPTDRVRMVMAISRRGVPFDTVDGEPAHIFMAVVAPEQHPASQLRLLARISRVLRDDGVRQRLLGAPDRESALRIVVEEEARH